MAELNKMNDQELEGVAGGFAAGTWVTVSGLRTGYLALRTNPTYDYVWYNGYTTTQDPEHLLNLTISKTLGSFTVGLRGYDLLNQAKTLNISESGNYYSESRTNMLGRYVLLTVSYRFGSFGGRRMGGGRGGFGGGMGGGRGGRF